MKTLSRTMSLKRDGMLAKKKAVRVAKSKASNAVERARGLQRSGSKQGKQASKTRSGYRMK